ncbi:hypothetical protein RI129_001610 [Pyrocoelia pectoralis]|uniref:1-acyl-sn-glycerol-3-phosphate acyltransferase n=1 Tax=Pyrocoelia pectoralis TaxID=417401 RepID=A0AAN7VV64_9COLE
MNASYLEILLAACVLLLPFLYESSQACRYYLRFIIYYTWVMFFSVCLIPIMALKAGDVRNFLYAAFCCKPISSILGLRWILRGKEHLEVDRACIIVSNHQSSIDILGLFDIWQIMDKCTVVAKKELLYAGPFGIAAWLCGLIFIDRVHSHSARNSVNEAADIVKRKKTKLWVFPEGTRRNTGEIHSFKKGAFHMAISAQIPILPIVFTRYYFLDSKQKRFDCGNIIMTTLAPISTEGMCVDDIDKLLETTRNAMIPVFHETNREVMESIGISSSTID